MNFSAALVPIGPPLRLPVPMLCASVVNPPAVALSWSALKTQPASPFWPTRTGDGEAAGDARHLGPERLEEVGQVHGRGLPLDVGVGAEDDFLDGLGVEALEELLDAELIGADALNGADGALQDVVATAVLPGLLN